SNKGLLLVLGALVLVLGAVAAFLLIPLTGDQIVLSFEVEPAEVQVVLDDNIIYDGPTPATYDGAEPGTYRLVISAEGYETIRRDVTLEAGEEYRIRWPMHELANPTLAIGSLPSGARILIDGVDTGRLTPATLTDLEPGRRQVQLLRDNFVSDEFPVTLAREAVSIDRELTVQRFTLALRVTPADAEYRLLDANNSREVRSGSGAADLTDLDGTISYVLLVNSGENHHSTVLSPSHEEIRTVEVDLLATEESERETPAPTPTREVPEREEPPVERETPREQHVEREREPEPRETERENREAQEQTQAAEQQQNQAAEPERENRETETRENSGESSEQEQVAAAQENQEESTESEAGSNDQSDEPGRLSVQSRPSAQVFVDGREIGYTPQVNIELSPGQHTVRLVNGEFGIDHTEVVTIEPGGSERVVHRQ
ncbi:MAG: PEGA domain-containing protein, partial [Myxococcales bacterium]|nr:PEGA domain-containing protein [Myxococcales bacterium]